MNRLVWLLAVTVLGLFGAFLLLLADHAGQSRRCGALEPTSFAYATYCTPEGTP